MPRFDYNLVDGVGRARQRSITPKLDGKVFEVGAIGPVVEFCNLAAGSSLSLLRSSSWFEDGPHKPLLDALAAKQPQWLSADGEQGLVTGEGLTHEQRLMSYKIDAHRAALKSGFTRAAPLLVAAMGELIGNVIDHSESPNPGVAIFAARPREFEFVIADNGVGALRSLTKNPEHAHLLDEGAALTAMVEAGVSRFERGTGHGNGFRPIFERLADMTGELRFRSGDYMMSLDGRFGDCISRNVAQKPVISGFFASVTCRVPAAA